MFPITVDGTHCRINEPCHPTMTKNSEYFSHKFGDAAHMYELAVSIFHNAIVHVSGPYPAATHDLAVFRQSLMGKLEKLEGRKAIGDSGYQGESGEGKTVSISTTQDSKAVRKFKGRAKARQESLNSRLKRFNIMDHRFRHRLDRHKLAFEAVVVILQYQLEDENPLFDV